MVVWQQCLNKPNLPEALAETSKQSQLGTVPSVFAKPRTSGCAELEGLFLWTGEAVRTCTS